MLIMNREYDTPSEDKNNSKDSHLRISEKAQTVIVELNSMHGQAKDKILELIDILKNEDKLKDHQIKRVLFETVDFVSKATLYRALPQEFKKVTKPAKPLPKTINVAHKVIDVSSEEEIEKIGEIRRAEWQKQANEDKFKSDLIDPLSEEDPKDLEIQFLKEKVSELEEALKKTQQFQPATTLGGSLDETAVFEFLAKRDNGVNCYWYPNYGINLVPSRILTDLKSRGVKLFKRLYFEV